MTTTYDDGGERRPATAAPQRLRAEHRDGLGIGERTPRLSWRLPPGAARQVAYELRLDDGTCERVEGDATVLVPWPGRPLDLRRAARRTGARRDRPRH